MTASKPSLSTPTIELIFDSDCPNAQLARQRLEDVERRHPWIPHHRQWERSDPVAPAHVRRYGSPTILVNGRDVLGLPPAEAACCRLYRGANGQIDGAPSIDNIEQALNLGAIHGAQRVGLCGSLVAVAMAILPVAGCPACWPAWLSVLASLGLGFLVSPAWQMALLMMAVTFMTVIAWRRCDRWRPWLLTCLVSGWAMGVLGKFVGMAWLAWLGTALLVLAGLKLAWAPSRKQSCDCPS